jgi:hypothetical protein
MQSSTSRWFEIVTAVCAAACLSVAADRALAHTTIKSQTTEGVRDDNALRIGHGCEAEDGTKHAVIAQSVVFPTDAPQLSASDSSVVLTSLDQVIAQGSLAGLVGGIQDRSIFALQGVKTDANGNVIGFYGKAGYLIPELAGRVPFQFTAPNFQPDSCATRLLVKVAIADICSLRPPLLQPGKVNLWIPDNGSQFAVPGIDGIGAPATLTINRNILTNPIPASCGGGYSVTVTPSPAQIDRDLPIARYWRVR